MLEHSGHFALRKLLNNDFNQGALDYSRIAPVVISTLVDIAAKKVPQDTPFSNKQVDNIIQKVKFTPVPKSVFNDHIYKEELVQESPEAEPKLVKTLV